MKILVLGATGGIGSEIVSQAAERAHQVTALRYAHRSGLPPCVIASPQSKVIC